jgi:6,7-dimethyl-8-ribityllumazine synthase
MLKSLHIGRYLSNPGDLREVTDFLETIGFDRMTDESGRSAIFAAPLGLLSINALSTQYPPEILDRLKDVTRLIVIEVSNPDAVFEIVQKNKLKVLADNAHPETGERSFSLELPGEIIITIHGRAEDAPSGIAGDLNAQGKHFAVVVARFNSFITERLLQGALDGLRRSGAQSESITVLRVPGSFEIPSAARTLAQTGKYDAIICLGCLLRGDTAHYDVIVNEVTRGIGQSAQETGVPHAFGVLTCDTLEQAIDRAGLKMGNKGFEAALAAVEMANLKEAISSQPSAVNRTTSVRSEAATGGIGKSAPPTAKKSTARTRHKAQRDRSR